ncbi:serine/threonine-protein kinase Nek4 [Clonorchis sinensis]|nr:serine/threonine-protein kinase Nek4 [Clonorchis sinensis]
MALNFLHKNGLLHGNVKSRNIFLKNGHVKLCGLEQCRLPATTSKIYDPFFKTLYHLSPEVWKEGVYTHKADVWSLGLVIYEMCTQEYALNETGLIRVLWQSIQQSCPRLPPSYSDELQHLIDAMLTKDPETRPNTSELFHYPFLMRQLFDMNRRLKHANIEISGIPIREQLDELRKFWEVAVDSTNSEGDDLIETPPDSSVLHLEGSFSEVVKSDATKVDDAVSESELTQESRIDTNASKNGPEDEQVLSYPKETETFSPWREKQRFQIPEEKLLQELRSLANAVLKTKTDADEPEDLVWPAPIAIYDKISHPDNVPLKEYTIQKTQRTQRCYSEEPFAPYTNKRTQVEEGQVEITKEVYEEQAKVPEYWKLYTETWVTEQGSKSRMGTNGALQPVLETTTGEEQPEFVQQYELSCSETATADPNRQTLMTVTNKPITVCEPQLMDINISKATILTQGKQPDPTRSRLVSGDDKPEERIPSLGDLEKTSTAEETHVSLEKLSNSPCGDAVAEYQVSGQSKIRKLRFDVKWIDAANLRNLCVTKLGPELFAKVYNFLYTKRIDEQNTAGELTIVNGLRTLLKEPSLGFAVDQLVLLEHVRNQ